MNVINKFRSVNLEQIFGEHQQPNILELVDTYW